jgi:hypothetical protein
MLQPRQHHLSTCLLYLARQEDLIEDRIDLVEVEDQIQLAHIAKEGIEDLNKEVNRLEVGKLVVVGIYARAEEEAGVSPVDHFVVAELDKVALVFLVTRRDETVDLQALVRAPP